MRETRPSAIHSQPLHRTRDRAAPSERIADLELRAVICSFYLALIARHRSDLRSAVRLAKRARTIYPESWLTQRIKDEFRL